MSDAELPPLTILFAIPTLPPIGGGAEVHAARLATALRARGHEVRIQTIAEDCASATTSPVPGAGTPVTRRAYSLRLARTILLARGRYSVAHFFLGGRHSALGGLACWATGCPHVVMYGGSGTFPELQASWLGRLTLKADARLADRLIALNEGMRAGFRACGAPEERIVVLPCEVDPELFRAGEPAGIEATRARYGIAAAARVVTFVGRFVAEKELATLVAAFGRVAAADPGAVLVLAGDGPEREAVAGLVRRLPDPARVVLTGKLAELEVRDLLQASDVFALVSSLEGIPSALVEAMAVGLPCVVSEIDGTKDVVTPGANGLRVPVRDPEALAGALLDLLSDPGRRRAMGEESRRRVLERYTPDIVAEAHERLYRDVVAEASRRRSGRS